MKLISLNTWGGALREELLTFLESHKDVDIFCFQEIHAKDSDRYQFNYTRDPFLFDSISKILPNHTAHFSPHLEDWFGVAIFIKKNLPIVRDDERYIYKEKGYIPESDFRLNARLVQGIELNVNNKKLSVFNLHGVWQVEGKRDTPDRIKQSENILEFASTFGSAKIICGDFNARPEIKSISMLEEAGYRNLIKKFGIPSTRSNLYTKPEKFADYIFVSPEVKVLDFKVLSEVVSDHSPLFLEFEII